MMTCQTTTATTVEEILKLGQAGWIKYDELTINGTTFTVIESQRG